MLLMKTVLPTSITIPLVGKYIVFTTVVVSLSVLMSVIVLNVYFRSPSFTGLHRITEKVFLDILPRLVYEETRTGRG